MTPPGQHEAAALEGAVDPGSSLRSRVLRGLAWKSISQVVLQGERVVVAVILARLLTPREYGLAGMALVFSGLVLVFSNLGFGAALVQRRTLTEKDRSTVFWTNLGIACAFTALAIAASGLLADLYREPAVQPLFAVLSLVFVLHALESTQIALLNRDLHFRALEIRKMTAAVCSATVAITAAAAGAGAWSFIASQLVFAAISAALVWRFSSWRPKFTYSWTSLRNLGGYGTKVFGWNLLFFMNKKADNVLIGRYLGPSALGLYSFAYNVILFPFSQIASPITHVLFPAFSRLQDDPERVASLWLRAQRMVAVIAIPALLGMIVVAPDFVHVVLGERWSGAVPVIQILCWVGLLQSLQRLNSSVLQACGRPSAVLYFAVIAFVASITSFVVGLRWGIVGVAAAFAVATTLIQPFYTWLTLRAVGKSFRTLAHSLGGVVQASAGMLACVLLVRTALVQQGAPSAARLAVSCLVGIAVFVPLCLWRSPEVLRDARTLLRGSRRASRRRDLAPAQEEAIATP